MAKLLMLAMSIVELEKTQHLNVCGILRVIKEVFKPNFLRKPTQVDLEKQLRVNVKRG
jgi:hypothetical protein